MLAAEAETTVPRRAWLLAIGGLALMLASFLEPALPLLGQSAEAAARFVPSRFLWAVYLPGVALLMSGLFLGRPRRRAVAVAARPQKSLTGGQSAAASGGCSSEPRHSFRASSRYGLLKRAEKPCCR